jgi:hypothetical protein
LCSMTWPFLCWYPLSYKPIRVNPYSLV